MDTAPVYRSYAVQTVQSRTDLAPVRDAVQTELPQPSQSVAATGETVEPTLDPARRPPDPLSSETRRELAKQVAVDEPTRSLVFKTVDQRSGLTVRQIPDEAILKLRAYVQRVTQDEAQRELAREA